MTQASTVRDVAELARLSIAPSDVEQVTQEFNQTLGLFDALTATQTDHVEPMVNPCQDTQRLRVDEVKTLVDREGLMQNAPMKDHDYFLVPRVID